MAGAHRDHPHTLAYIVLTRTMQKGRLFSMTGGFLLLYLLGLTLGFRFRTKEEMDDITDYELYELIDRMTSLTQATTFYELLEVESSANTTAISTAFRRKSILWHPDRNQQEKDAQERFSLLSAVAAILRNEKSRQRYDWILNEAPIWHKSGYYSQRYMTTKLSVPQVFLLGIFFITIVQICSELGHIALAKYHQRNAQKRLNLMGKSERNKLERRLNKGAEWNEWLLAQSPEVDNYLTATAEIPPFAFGKLFILRVPLALARLIRGRLLTKTHTS